MAIADIVDSSTTMKTMDTRTLRLKASVSAKADALRRRVRVSMVFIVVDESTMSAMAISP